MIEYEGYTIDWATNLAVTWMTNEDTEPVPEPSGYTTIVLWMVHGDIYGARVGDRATGA